METITVNKTFESEEALDKWVKEYNAELKANGHCILMVNCGTHNLGDTDTHRIESIIVL